MTHDPVINAITVVYGYLYHIEKTSSAGRPDANMMNITAWAREAIYKLDGLNRDLAEMSRANKKEAV